MVHRMVVLVLGAATCFAAAPPSAHAGGPPGHGGRHGAPPPADRGACAASVAGQLETLPVEELSEAEATALRFLREEEKLARDVYRTLGAVHNVPVFANIAPAEQHHMDLLALLVHRYGLDDPVTDDAVGAFTDPRLRSLYGDLVSRGRRSLEDALRVGATIEDMDLADLSHLDAASDNADVRLVVANLSRGSRNHLRAFTRVLDRRGFEPYAPEHLDASAYQAILAAGHERGSCAHAGGAGPGAGARGGGGPRHGQCRRGANP